MKKRWLRWFGHVEHKKDDDSGKRCVTLEVKGTTPLGGIPKKTCVDVGRNDIRD